MSGAVMLSTLLGVRELEYVVTKCVCMSFMFCLTVSVVVVSGVVSILYVWLLVLFRKVCFMCRGGMSWVVSE